MQFRYYREPINSRMIKTSTTENLVLYLFNETGMSDSVLIQRDIDEDPEVEHEFETIKSAMDFVDNALIAPAPHCLTKILAYSAATA
jgi:hypothetical protein